MMMLVRNAVARNAILFLLGVATASNPVQAARLLCIFLCTAALAGLAWGLFATVAHRPDMRRMAYAAVTVGACALALLLLSALFTEVGRFLDADKLTWRLPVNVAGSAGIVAMVGLFARSGWSPPRHPAAGTTRTPPLVAVGTIMFLMVATSSVLTAWEANQNGARIDRIVRVVCADHPTDPTCR